jgi:hypothetical protein
MEKAGCFSRGGCSAVTVGCAQRAAQQNTRKRKGLIVDEKEYDELEDVPSKHKTNEGYLKEGCGEIGWDEGLGGSFV